MNANRQKTRPPRRGFTALEVATSVLVLMTSMGMTVRVVGWVATDRRAADRRQWAAGRSKHPGTRLVRAVRPGDGRERPGDRRAGRPPAGRCRGRTGR